MQSIEFRTLVIENDLVTSHFLHLPLFLIILLGSMKIEFGFLHLSFSNLIHDIVMLRLH